MSLQFYETVMGRRFIEGTIPKLCKDIEELTKAVETLNVQVQSLSEELKKKKEEESHET